VLTGDGYRVRIVQQPLTGLEEDVAATQRVLDQQDGPVILVGHSYGGSIITVAGSDPKVKALVYVAALQPDVGESSGEVAPPMPPASNDLKTTKDGFVFLDPAKFAADFGADLPKAQAGFMARSQMPVAAAASGRDPRPPRPHRVDLRRGSLRAAAARGRGPRAGGGLGGVRAGQRPLGMTSRATPSSPPRIARSTPRSRSGWPNAPDRR